MQVVRAITRAALAVTALHKIVVTSLLTAYLLAEVRKRGKDAFRKRS